MSNCSVQSFKRILGVSLDTGQKLGVELFRTVSRLPRERCGTVDPHDVCKRNPKCK